MERSTGKADQKRSICGIRSLFPKTLCILLLTVFSVFSGAQESQGMEGDALSVVGQHDFPYFGGIRDAMELRFPSGNNLQQPSIGGVPYDGQFGIARYDPRLVCIERQGAWGELMTS